MAQVAIDYSQHPQYPLLRGTYSHKEAVKILQSGVPINRPNWIPSLQVPTPDGSGCDPLSLGMGKVGITTLSPGMRGLGIAYAPGTVFVDDPCQASPRWCDWLPGADYFDACKVIDPVACSAPGPAMTPANVATAQTAGDASVAAYCAANPSDCAAFARAGDTASLEERLKEVAYVIGGGLAIVALVMVIKR